MTRHSISWPGLNLQILIAAVAGLILGYWLNGMDDSSALRSNILYAANVMGRLFIDLLKMILIPLIFT
ncbi:cation:dicarboxylase symporter family transporter, partial [Wenyingzhuangia sp. 1_MG-2023]|nr:cation:dicarboxylase symporter family transporter [Wenyingzhuangia sp. 1_MG-2023]